MPAKDYRSDPNFREFVRWHNTPKWKREEEGLPETQKEFADEIDVSPNTLTNWKSQEAFDELTEELIGEWVKGAIPQCVQAAKKVATQPDEQGYKDRRMLFKMAGLLADNVNVLHGGEVDHTHTIEDARTMDEGSLRSAMKAELRSRPEFAEASDERLDGMIDAFVAANAEGGGDAPKLPDPKDTEMTDPTDQPSASKSADPTKEYVLSGAEATRTDPSHS